MIEAREADRPKVVGIPRVARCACGEWVLGVSTPPGQSKFWCGQCAGFVEAIMRSTLPAAALPEEGIDLDAYLGHLARSLIEQAVARTPGNHAAAARLLRLNRTTLVERLKRFGHALGEPPREAVRARRGRRP